MTPRNALAPATEHTPTTLGTIYSYLIEIGRRAAEDAARADLPDPTQPREREGEE